MIGALRSLEPFESVFDVGGNVGGFAETARGLWPQARITSFEPIPELAQANRARAEGSWWVEQVALSDVSAMAALHVCENQHSASTMQEPGTVRRERFGIRDLFRTIEVATEPLDSYLGDIVGRLLVKVDVEGHEGRVLAGAGRVLREAAAVIVECNAPGVFEGSAPVFEIDAMLREAGLRFAGVVGALLEPAGEVVQFDGLWLR